MESLSPMNTRHNIATFSLLALAMTGCTAHLAPVVSTSFPRNAVALGVAEGKSEADYFLRIKMDGDDSVSAAIADALRGKDAHDLVNIVVERDLWCFPACGFDLYRSVETKVRGTLIKYLEEPGHPLQLKPTKASGTADGGAL
jgi:hypothetical protein